MADDRTVVDYAASSPSIPGSPITPQPPGTARIRKVSAMSDFAPINIKIKRSVSGYSKIAVLLTVHHKPDRREGQAHRLRNKSGHLSFYGGRCWSVHFVQLYITVYADCIQLLIALFIACEFGCYVTIRQVVNAKEWLMACQLPTLESKSYERSLRHIPTGRGRKGLLRKRLRASTTYQVGLYYLSGGIFPLIRA
jgi:hypothetical protein